MHTACVKAGTHVPPAPANHDSRVSSGARCRTAEVPPWACTSSRVISKESSNQVDSAGALFSFADTARSALRRRRVSNVRFEHLTFRRRRFPPVAQAPEVGMDLRHELVPGTAVPAT